jgi:hypothetical protein
MYAAFGIVLRWLHISKYSLTISRKLLVTKPGRYVLRHVRLNHRRSFRRGVISIHAYYVVNALLVPGILQG